MSFRSIMNAQSNGTGTNYESPANDARTDSDEHYRMTQQKYMPVAPKKVLNARRDPFIAEITRTAVARLDLHALCELDSGLSPARPRSQS